MHSFSNCWSLFLIREYNTRIGDAVNQSAVEFTNLFEKLFLELQNKQLHAEALGFAKLSKTKSPSAPTIAKAGGGAGSGSPVLGKPRELADRLNQVLFKLRTGSEYYREFEQEGLGSLSFAGLEASVAQGKYSSVSGFCCCCLHVVAFAAGLHQGAVSLLQGSRRT